MLVTSFNFTPKTVEWKKKEKIKILKVTFDNWIRLDNKWSRKVLANL
jgi:hypothetical protein